MLFILKVFIRVKVRALCKTLEFFHFNLVIRTVSSLCTGASSCWHRVWLFFGAPALIFFRIQLYPIPTCQMTPHRTKTANQGGYQVPLTTVFKLLHMQHPGVALKTFERQRYRSSSVYVSSLAHDFALSSSRPQMVVSSPRFELTTFQ